ncbi:MAG: nucleotide exchange factor GrpE [Deltaproteobacteria bacterium]
MKLVNETDNDQIFNDKQRTSAQLIEKVRALESEKEENRDLYLRAKADTENMKRRFQKEKQDLVKYGTETLIKQLLPVADNLEKAIAHSQEKVSLKTLQEGVNLTLKGFMDTLKKAGVAPIEAVGEPFDPNFHEAMSEIEAKDAEPGTVVNEFQKGYTLNDRLLRPSMVVISKKPA